MTKRSIAPLALLILALAPATANAAVRCVPSAAPGCDAYAESVTTSKRLTFVGAGSGTLESAAGATVIVPASGTPLNLSGGGTVRSLRAAGATGFIGATALVFLPS